ncbi:hypothetical protein [Nonlabens sp.]|uniref:hypothetical protein n=1 Tax=Nonlabens sp. TaxID=1888209 RepID=UPI003F69AA6E
MKHYYYSDGISEFGPFTLTELKTKRLRPDFKIRVDAISFTELASNIPELESLFKAPAPVQKTKYQQTHYYKKEAPENSKRDQLLLTVLIIWVTSLVLNLIVSFIFRDSISSGIKTEYVIMGVINLLTAVLPVMIALSIQNRTLKIIGIIIAAILTLRFVYGAVQLMTFSF